MPSCQVFAVRCPRSHECSKGGSIVKKGPSISEVREGLRNHLACSPYHEGLTSSQVEALVASAEVESWAEEWDEAPSLSGSASGAIGAGSRSRGSGSGDRGRTRSPRPRQQPVPAPKTPPRAPSPELSCDGCVDL